MLSSLSSTKIIRGEPSPYALSVKIKVGTDPITRGNKETFYVTVSDRSDPRRKIADLISSCYLMILETGFINPALEIEFKRSFGLLTLT